MIPKIPFADIYVEPHPYLPYVTKKNFITPKTTSAQYPLNRDKKYVFGRYLTNSMGYINGPKGNREIIVPKPEGLIRINCLGASTTGNYLDFDGKNFSYPLELEKILKKEFPEKNIEVNNCGVGGRTSAEILIDFALNIIDTKPDIIVIYHGYTDLAPSITRNFRSDYSHAKRNLGEVWHYYKIASMVPSVPLASYNFIVNKLFGYNIRNSLLNAISRGKIDLSSAFNGIQTYRRNIEHIVNLCKANGINVVLSTFCHYMYDDIKNSRIHIKYKEGVLMENEAIRDIALKNSIILVDNYRLFRYEEKYFVDSIHFSPEGMNLLASNISKALIPLLER